MRCIFAVSYFVTTELVPFEDEQPARKLDVDGCEERFNVQNTQEEHTRWYLFSTMRGFGPLGLFVAIITAAVRKRLARLVMEGMRERCVDVLLANPLLCDA